MYQSESKGSKLAGILFIGFFIFLCIGVGILGIYSGINDLVNT